MIVMVVPNVNTRQTQKAIARDAERSAAKLQAVRLRECKIGVCTLFTLGHVVSERIREY